MLLGLRQAISKPSSLFEELPLSPHADFVIFHFGPTKPKHQGPASEACSVTAVTGESEQEREREQETAKGFGCQDFPFEVSLVYPVVHNMVPP